MDVILESSLGVGAQLKSLAKASPKFRTDVCSVEQYAVRLCFSSQWRNLRIVVLSGKTSIGNAAKPQNGRRCRSHTRHLLFANRTTESLLRRVCTQNGIGCRPRRSVPG